MQTRLELIHGNIMDAEVDAIVNPTDLVLSGGGGLDFVIREAAGEEVDRVCEQIRENYGGCQTGEAVITSAGNLSAKYIIHTAGPIWVGGRIGEEKLLESCHRECLQLALENGIQSIAFPAISTGTFRYPLDKAAPVALNAVIEFVEQAQQRGDSGAETHSVFPVSRGGVCLLCKSTFISRIPFVLRSWRKSLKSSLKICCLCSN